MFDMSRHTRCIFPFLALGLSAFFGGGACATTQASSTSSNDRSVPVEVADHTIDGSSELDRSIRPLVEVSMERSNMIGINRTGYEGRVRRGAIRCYRERLRRANDGTEGTAVYELIVTRNGRVAGTDVMSTALRERQFKSCVQDVLSRLRFDVPSNRRPVYRLFFRLKFHLETIVADEPPV